MVNSHWQFFIFGKQSSSLFRGNTAFQQNRCNFPHSLDMLKTGLFFTFFVKMNCLEKRELIITFGLDEAYAISTVYFKRREFFNNCYF